MARRVGKQFVEKKPIRKVGRDFLWRVRASSAS